MMTPKILAKDKCRVAVFASLIIVSAQTNIPLPHGVPFTLQTMAIMLSGMILGSKKGVLAVLIYVSLGAIGLPVFAGLRGGLSVIAGPTGGFIISFPLMALTAGIGASLSKKGKKLLLLMCLILAVFINYLCGMLWFSYVLNVELQAALIMVVLPFVLGSILEIILIMTITPFVKRAFMHV